MRVVVEETDGAGDDATAAEEAEAGVGVVAPVVVVDVDERDQAVLIFQYRRRPRLPGLRLAWEPAVDRGDARRLAEEEAQGIVVVDRVVHDLEPGRPRHPGPKVPGGADADLDSRVSRLPECALLDQLARHANAGVPPHLLVDRQLDARLAGRRDQPGGGRVVGGERLLAEEVLARRRRPLRDRHLRLRRDGDVDDLHLVIREQVVEGGGNPRDAVGRRGSFRRSHVAVVAGDDAEAAGLVGRQVGVVDDTAAADDPDPPVAADRERDRVVDLIPGRGS